MGEIVGWVFNVSDIGGNVHARGAQIPQGTAVWKHP